MRPLTDVLVWHAWDTAAFAVAHAEARPVLLLLTTRWSPACRRLHDEVLASRDVVAALTLHVVPVAVDADERPDIAERYGAGAWPTLTFLTPQGAVLVATTWTEPGELVSLVATVARRFRERRTELSRVAPARTGPSPADAVPGDPGADQPAHRPPLEPTAVLQDAVDQALAAADLVHGGFGGAPKFPLLWPTRTLLAAIADAESASTDVRGFVIRTMDAMVFGPLWDVDHGGFWRLALGEDWSRPERAKLLEVNIDLVDLLLHAHRVLDMARYRERARETVAFVMSTLRAPAGGFYGSAWPERDGWVRDETLQTDLNAHAVQTLIRASAAFDPSQGLARVAIEALERLVPEVYRPGAGVAHYWREGARVRGLLVDQVATAGALLDAGRLTGDAAYPDLAEELMTSAWAKYWVPGWGWRDRLPTLAGAGMVGLLAEPWQPFITSCAAARVLAQLTDATGRAHHLDRARTVLDTLAPAVARQGLDGGAFALAVLEVYRAR